MQFNAMQCNSIQFNDSRLIFVIVVAAESLDQKELEMKCSTKRGGGGGGGGGSH